MGGRALGAAVRSTGTRSEFVTAPAQAVAGSVGVLGGTFDPIHIGHLALAEEAREALGLERILFVPAAMPPHKLDQEVTHAEHRRTMVELAISGNPAFELSTIELERVGPSYTVDTLEELAREAPAITLILSAESYHGLPGWDRPRRLLELARVAVAPRAGYQLPPRTWLEEQFPGLVDRVVFLDGPNLWVSASAIRARVAAGRSVRYLVPSDVVGYIAEHGLYRDTGAGRTGFAEPGIMDDNVTRTNAS
jgi:nicotinate-nucleotide adenylyltransferase